MTPERSSTPETVVQYLTNRRKFLAGTAGIAATGLAGCTGDDGGQSNGDDMATPSPSPTPEETATAEQTHPDIDVLNYALTLEHLEHVFYRQGLNEYSDDELSNADALSQFGEQVRMEVPGRLKTVRDQEKAHVDKLGDVVDQLGGTPVGEAEYSFGHTNPSEFLGLAKALENTGVAAYKGAAGFIKTNAYLSAALAVHSVEARHASFLNLLNNSSPFPNAFGKAKSVDEVLEIAGQFIESDVQAPELGGEEGEAERKGEDDTTDVNVLNFALTLEHLEYAFYRDGLKQYSDDQIAGAERLEDFSEDFRTSVPGHLVAIRDHEKVHVDEITKTVNKLGGDPVEEASYDFGYETPSEFLGVAKALENTGVSAYAGAAPTVSNDAVFTAAAKIHDVEARHASFLNELNGSSPFPKAFDQAKSMDEVKEIAGQFIQDS